MLAFPALYTNPPTLLTFRSHLLGEGFAWPVSEVTSCYKMLDFQILGMSQRRLLICGARETLFHQAQGWLLCFTTNVFVVCKRTLPKCQRVLERRLVFLTSCSRY